MSARTVGALLVPVVVSQAFIIGFSALSPMLVADAGPAAISAVSTVEYLNVFLVGVFLALATAGSIIVAQDLGRGTRDGATGVAQACGATLAVSVLPALAVGAALAASSGPVAQALLGPAGDDAVGFARVYLVGLAAAYPAQALVEAVSAALRGAARTVPALWLTVAMNGGYLLAALVLVRCLGLGVAGLAVAIVAARYLSAVLAVLLLVKSPLLAGAGSRLRVLWRPGWAAARRVILLGIPFAAEALFFSGGKLVTQTFVVGMGTPAITANAVAQSLISLSEIVPQAMCLALVPIVGQAVGAGRLDDARRLIRSFLVASTGVSVAAAAAMLAVFGWLEGLYNTPDAIRRDVLAIFLLASAARLLFWWAGSYLLPSGLRAAGDAVFTTTVASVTMVLRVAAIWIVGVALGYGVVGVWAVQVAEWGVRSVAFAIRFHGAAWERKARV
ncbi:MAG: hypothetical protein LBC97_05810 [Bifidobacteriaceae bacterium]|jgi:Na+-driven multidrug efflux pump|nr:hypothetical protein [Bifidobacteriaceae bacterium]